jgi:ABC-type sugar transport system substrate-binding protein
MDHVRPLVVLLAVVMLYCVAPLEADPAGGAVRVAVFTPTSEGNTYWPEVQRVMRAAAADLAMDIAFYEFDVSDRFAKSDEGVRILRTPPLPDAAIFSVAYGQAAALMDAAEQLGIPFFLHGPLFPAELEALGGGPRRRYRQWIGYFHEDEVEKGYLLARELIAAARASAAAADPASAAASAPASAPPAPSEPTGASAGVATSSSRPLRVVGISGDGTWYGTALREAGLRRAVAEDPTVELLQIVPTRWTEREGREMTARLLSRYGDIDVVWCASDQLAIGAAEALADRDGDAPRGSFTGGLDLSPVGLEAVRAGTLIATVAAPFEMWAEVLGYLRGYLDGDDFADRLGTEVLFSPVVATAETAEDHLRTRNR